jgi:hypothetical protein
MADRNAIIKVKAILFMLFLFNIIALSAQRYEKKTSPPNDEPEFSVALSGERPAKDKKIKR